MAYFHSELSRNGPGLLLRDILKVAPEVKAWARAVVAADADILVLGDVDYDLSGVALQALADLAGGYPHRFTRPPNRGVHLGRDLDGNGRLGDPGDAEGYAEFAGQGGMAVLSRWPLVKDEVRDFTAFRWADLPGAMLVGDGRDPERLSTTVHWDVPVALPDGQRLHLLIWHGTAPVFDGPEDRNGRRNHDEARFWHLYLDGALGVAPPDNVVLMGTANADPDDGESLPAAIRGLLTHPGLQDPRPASKGAVTAARQDGGVNLRHRSDPALDTVDWPDAEVGPGNLRVDYVLPARHLVVTGSGVLWPEPDTSLGGDVASASRHRLVWVDIEMGERLTDRR